MAVCARTQLAVLDLDIYLVPVRLRVLEADVLDVDESVLIDRFLSGIKTIAAISLALNYPTIVSITHSLVNAYKNLIAISLATEYTFEGSEKVSLLLCLAMCPI